MDPLVGLVQRTSLVEAELLIVTFLLCSLIGLERQMRQKSAGYRTHVLVGLGSCAFTLVSAYGFAAVLGEDVNLDPSRIAAQIVSGIGFLGAGVIFKGRSMVRGLTTAATVWVSAAVGMACGSGMLSLAIVLTALHLITLFLVAPLVRRVPGPDRHRLLRVTYADGTGALRDVLGTATNLGFATSIQSSRRITGPDDKPRIVMDIRFIGRPPVRDLIPPLMELSHVEGVSLTRSARGAEAESDDG